MAIRPEDFDASPGPAPVSKSPAGESLFARQERARQERTISSSGSLAKTRTAWTAWAIAIACLLVALIMFSFAKPLAKLVDKLLAKPASSQIVEKSVPNGVTPRQPPPGSQGKIKISPPPNPPPKKQELRSTRPKRQVNYPPLQPKKAPDNSQGEATEPDVERQQAAELEKKRLSDQKTALETQRQEEAQQAARDRERERQEE